MEKLDDSAQFNSEGHNSCTWIKCQRMFKFIICNRCLKIGIICITGTHRQHGIGFFHDALFMTGGTNHFAKVK